MNDELEIETLDGKRHLSLSSAAPIRDETGSYYRRRHQLSQDITELRRLEQEVADARPGAGSHL